MCAVSDSHLAEVLSRWPFWWGLTLVYMIIYPCGGGHLSGALDAGEQCYSNAKHAFLHMFFCPEQWTQTQLCSLLGFKVRVW